LHEHYIISYGMMQLNAPVAPTTMNCCHAIFIVIYSHMAIAAACSCRQLYATVILRPHHVMVYN